MSSKAFSFLCLWYVHCVCGMCIVVCVLWYVYCGMCIVICVLWYVYCGMCTVVCVFNKQDLSIGISNLHYIKFVIHLILGSLHQALLVIIPTSASTGSLSRIQELWVASCTLLRQRVFWDVTPCHRSMLHPAHYVSDCQNYFLFCVLSLI
jgi:hypothetical protein